MAAHSLCATRIPSSQLLSPQRVPLLTQIRISKPNSLNIPIFISRFPPCLLLRKPISTNVKAFASNPRNPSGSSFLKECARSIGFFAVGLLISMGSFNNPALADVKGSGTPPSLEEKLDAQGEKAVEADASPSLEGKVETQDEKVDEDLYMRLLERNPRDVEALKVVLYGRMRAGKTKEAIKYVERLIEVQPDEVEWKLIQALSYELLGQLSKAKRLFKKILEERPLNLRALHGLALVMHKRNEGPAAFEMLNDALDLAQREARVTEERNIKILIAQMHVVKGELEEGLREFEDLVKEDPRDFRPYLCQGIIYSLLDMKEQAEEQFNNYQSLVPHEFPQRGFLDEVMISAKTESREHLEKEFAAQYTSKK
ncbi:SLOW GREEN 1 protein [Nymphaea thermarum]|nr:SLOW GREEN 1 protein [Nymphaea thermarum]